MTIGILVILLAGWWFGAIAEDVVEPDPLVLMDQENPLVTLSSYGFPSGHTMGATLLYGLFALLAARTLKTGSARVACFVAAGLLILMIGLSRIYLGAHFLSDVLGAIAAGIAWLAVCWTAAETWRRRRAHHERAREK